MATVRDVQRRLIALGYDVGPADGVRGPKTIAAIKGFQKDYGLVVDGIAGKQTLAAMKQAETAPKSKKPEPDKSAIQKPSPIAAAPKGEAKAPPNVASLKLLDTARPIKELIWHCSATREGQDFTVEDIRSWHKQRGWSDIGYHYVVYRDGRIMAGRPVGQIGAHVEGHNTGTVGCCYVGGVNADNTKPKDTRTPEQRASMLWLTEQLVKKFPIKTISGHNQYNKGKACPSFYVHNDQLGAVI